MKKTYKHFRGLYWQQLFITAGMVMLTLVLLGVSFFSLSFNYARQQRETELRSKADTLVLDAAAIARDNDNPKGMNVVLLGALIQSLGLQNIDWATALRSCVKSRFVDVNLRCLDAGMRASVRTAE